MKSVEHPENCLIFQLDTPSTEKACLIPGSLETCAGDRRFQGDAGRGEALASGSSVKLWTFHVVFFFGKSNLNGQ